MASGARRWWGSIAAFLMVHHRSPSWGPSQHDISAPRESRVTRHRTADFGVQAVACTLKFWLRLAECLPHGRTQRAS